MRRDSGHEAAGAPAAAIKEKNIGNVNRRMFLKETAALSTGMAGLARVSLRVGVPPVRTASGAEGIPTRTIGAHAISRLIIGGNPFSYIAHGEPLVYAGEPFRNYLTKDKIVETLAKAVDQGINTLIGRIDDHVIGFLGQYEKTAGRAMPWIAQTSKKPMQGASKADILANIRLAADHGAFGIYVHGESADYLVKNSLIADIAEYITAIRKLGLVAGIGAHDIATVEACRQAGIEPDFYMKTYNRLEFCCPAAVRTAEIMPKTGAPWIAFKVLAAGRLKPEQGFSDALKAGADFLCVGMFDFQVERNVKLAKTLL